MNKLQIATISILWLKSFCDDDDDDDDDDHGKDDDDDDGHDDDDDDGHDDDDDDDGHVVDDGDDDGDIDAMSAGKIFDWSIVHTLDGIPVLLAGNT